MLQIFILAAIPVEWKSSLCLICMKYRIIILIIIIINLGKTFLSYIANTSRTHMREHAHTHCRCHRTGYHYSVAPNRVGPLSWRQCRLLAIEINTGSGGPVSPRFWVFFAHKKFYTELRRELVTGCAVSRYEQFETFPETTEQELQPAVC